LAIYFSLCDWKSSINYSIRNVQHIFTVFHRDFPILIMAVVIIIIIQGKAQFNLKSSNGNKCIVINNVRCLCQWQDVKHWNWNESGIRRKFANEKKNRNLSLLCINAVGGLLTLPWSHLPQNKSLDLFYLKTVSLSSSSWFVQNVRFNKFCLLLRLLILQVSFILLLPFLYYLWHYPLINLRHALDGRDLTKAHRFILITHVLLIYSSCGQ
jgi:hypothetical protein